MKDLMIRAACDRALRRLADGDNDALAVLYEKLGRRIYLLALSILRDPHAAEDIMQDTFVRLATGGAAGYTPDSNPIAYILTVTRNLALNALPRRTRELPSDTIPEDAAPFGTAPDGEPFGSLEVLGLLDEEERQIVTLRLEYGMKHKDLADLLGISRAACEKKYSRAVAKMRAYYEDKHVTKTERKENRNETQKTLS